MRVREYSLSDAISWFLVKDREDFEFLVRCYKPPYILVYEDKKNKLIRYFFLVTETIAFFYEEEMR